ncbi:MAG: hypothetical protein JOY79_10525 [Acidobacteriaceae bacterium]|nr:hypothetical protein [Acidobacteriaceae bacterium]
MNPKKIMTALVILAAIAFVTSAFATDITVTKAMSLNGKQLAPGQYKVKYTGSGSDVQVNFIKGKDTVASAPARLEERNSKSFNDAVITDDNGSTHEIKEILLGGKKQVLVFSGAGASSSAMGAR